MFLLETPFGVDFVYKCSLALLSVLSLLWIFIFVLILWLRKIQHRVDKAILAEKLEKNNSWPHINNAFAYSGMDLDAERTDLRQTSFDSSAAQQEEQMVLNGSEKLFSSSEQPEQGTESDKRIIYKSLKSPTNPKYANLYEESSQNAAHRNIKMSPLHCNNNETNITDDQDYIVLIGAREDKEQSVKETKGDEQQSGNASKPLKNKNLGGLMDGDDTSQNEYENEYLAVIHSDTTSADSAANTKPRHEDESEYLEPIETAATEKRQEKDTESHPERKPKGTSGVERDARVQAGAHAEGGVQMNADDGDEDSYDYITTREVNKWAASPCNASTSQEARYIDKDTTIHARDESKRSFNENTDGYLTVIDGNYATTERQQDRENATDQVYDNPILVGGSFTAQPEAIYQN